MEIKNKDLVKVQSMAEKAMKQMKAIEEFLETYDDDPIGLSVLPMLNITTSNIYRIQDALGGEITYEPFWRDKFFEAKLVIDGVCWRQYGVTKLMMAERKGALDI